MKRGPNNIVLEDVRKLAEKLCEKEVPKGFNLEAEKRPKILRENEVPTGYSLCKITWKEIQSVEITEIYSHSFLAKISWK